MHRKIRFEGTATRVTMLCVKIDNIEIHNGTVAPFHVEPIPTLPKDVDVDAPYYGVVEWQTGPDEATHILEISVTGGTFHFSSTYSNYMRFWTLDDLNTARSSGPDNFLPAYARQESDTLYYRDSNSDVKINNILQPRVALNEWERIGQFHWALGEGDVFTSTMSLSETFDQSIWDPLLQGEFDKYLTNYLIWRPNHHFDH